jgi:hypothetical protein
VRGKLRDKRADMKRDRFKFKRELEGRRRLPRREQRGLGEWLDEQLDDGTLDLSDESDQLFDGKVTGR